MGLKHILFVGGIAVIALGTAPAFAADEPGKHDTAKGAAVGAMAGHELGSGHAAAGAAVGAGVGHHEKKKAQRNSNNSNQ